MLKIRLSRQKAVILYSSCFTLAVIAMLLALGFGKYYSPACTVQYGVQYGTRHDQKLLLDVITPDKPNGKALLVMISGSWKSTPAPLAPWMVAPFLHGGYTIFGIHHISQPESTVPEIVEDVKLAARFVRLHANKYGIDKNKIAISGGSSGGHLSLMVAATGDPGNPESENPLLRQSSQVQAVAIFYPVTDLIDMGDSTQNLRDGGPPKSFGPAFGMKDRDPVKWTPVGEAMSPLYNIKPGLPPILIFHGTADTLVPLDQSTRFQEKARSQGNIVEVRKVKGKGHGWLGMIWDIHALKRWTDKHLN